MHCDRLTVTEIRGPLGSSRELEAAGNTVVEGTLENGSFTARAVRMTYDEAKDLLVFEGDGWTDAELFRQQQIGGQPDKVAARKILYWPKIDRRKVIQARSFQLGQFPSSNREKW
jgi:hypothetical protein